MKTKGQLLAIINLLFALFFFSGVTFSQGISGNIIKKNPEKFTGRVTHQLSSAKAHAIKFPCLLDQYTGTLGDPHPDTMVVYSTSSSSMKELYTYNANLDVLTYTRQYFKPQGWINSFMISNFYDGSGYLTSSLLKDWQNSNWVDSMKIVNTYDATGNMLTSILQDW